MQYLITTFTDSIGHTHSHVTKAKDNQTFTVVEAESKEEAECKYNDLIQCANCGSWDTEYEYLYVNDIPIHLAFSCNNCNERYGKELVGDEKGYSINLKEKDSE